LTSYLATVVLLACDDGNLGSYDASHYSFLPVSYLPYQGMTVSGCFRSSLVAGTETSSCLEAKDPKASS